MSYHLIYAYILSPYSDKIVVHLTYVITYHEFNNLICADINLAVLISTSSFHFYTNRSIQNGVSFACPNFYWLKLIIYTSAVWNNYHMVTSVSLILCNKS
jgi:amino acid permease